MATLLSMLAGTACSGADAAQQAALRAGRDAVVPCQERFHEESRTYADCARYVASGRPTTAAADGWRRLGALTAGWISADRVGLLGDAEAEAAARELAIEANALQENLHASDASLRELMGMPRGNFDNRRRELLAPAPT